MTTIVNPAAAAIHRVSVFNCFVSGVCSRAVLASMRKNSPSHVGIRQNVGIKGIIPISA